MTKKVLHLLRKNTQLGSPFINNQIEEHIEFTPYVAFREHRNPEKEESYAHFDLGRMEHLDLSASSTLYERFLFKAPKVLSGRQVAQTVNFIERHQVDILHFHYGTDCGVFHPLLKYVDIPSVVSFYGYDCSSFPSFAFGYGGRYLKNRVFDRISGVFAMSPDMKRDLMRAGCPEDKITVHYYGTDTRRFFMERRYEPKETVDLLILAMLAPQKGHLFLLKSISHLLASGVGNFRLRIIGNGEMEKQLRVYVRNNNLSRHVTFTGAIKYASEEMIAAYQQADIFVHPSVEASNGDKEGIPGTIIEAMSAGLPVVSTYHAGIPYIIGHETTGLLVEEHDIPALSRSIRRLIADVGLRKKIGRTGQRHACKNLGLHAKETELEALYDKALYAWAAKTAGAPLTR